MDKPDELVGNEKSDAPDDQTKEFWTDWFRDATFTADWASRAFSVWDRCLYGLRDKPLDILEIGCWEGRSTLFFLNFFPLSRITCLDIFMLGNEGLFDANVIRGYSHRVRKITSRSISALDGFATREKRSFDLIYVDGSHERDDVMMDTLLSWRVLKVGGRLIWDDYEILTAMPGCFGRDQDPKPAIDAFLAWKEGEYELIHVGYQVIVKKTKPHYEVQTSLMDPGVSKSGVQQ
jgi:hypothetical protein